MQVKQPRAWQVASALLMILALLWLTASAPFVFGAAEAGKAQLPPSEQCEDSNPFANTTEEKNESSAGNASEYLHDALSHVHSFTEIAKFCKCRSTDTYYAFHPDSFSPPPEA